MTLNGPPGPRDAATRAEYSLINYVCEQKNLLRLGFSSQCTSLETQRVVLVRVLPFFFYIGEMEDGNGFVYNFVLGFFNLDPSKTCNQNTAIQKDMGLSAETKVREISKCSREYSVAYRRLFVKESSNSHIKWYLKFLASDWLAGFANIIWF